jgi:hypothetical protein
MAEDETKGPCKSLKDILRSLHDGDHAGTFRQRQPERNDEDQQGDDHPRQPSTHGSGGHRGGTDSRDKHHDRDDTLYRAQEQEGAEPMPATPQKAAPVEGAASV